MKQNCLKCIILTAAENTKNAKIFDKFPTSRSNIPCNLIRRLTSGNVEKKVCIVGAGPAGFYAAQQILKANSDVKVDIVEKLPVPFGLVRFGVAPDHPEVKNVINTFHKTACNPRVQFLGNVEVGKDVTIEQLKQFYHSIVLTYGAEEDRKLGIKGENLNNVISGRRFVGWYNGVPEDKDLEIDLDIEEAVVIGQGNVAIDISRILLTSIDELKTTDITSYALEQLSRSKVRKVWMAGRRGPLQAALTIAELREMTKLNDCKTIWRVDDFSGIKDIVGELKRPRKRLTELMIKSMEECQNLSQNQCSRSFHPVFLRSPVEFLGSNKLSGVKFEMNELVGDDLLEKSAKAIGKFEEIPCGLALRSIGFKSVSIDAAIPFDNARGRVINSSGKVDSKLYSAGWLATGPTGVILSTMNNAFYVGNLVAQELNCCENVEGSRGITDILKSKNKFVVSYGDWLKIDREEIEAGKKLGKPREKIVDVEKMLEIASS